MDTEAGTVTAEHSRESCEQAGYTVYKATFAGSSFVTQIRTVKTADPLGHDYTRRIQSDAYLKERALTCTTADTYWYACSRCSASAEEDGAAESCFYASLTFGPHHFDTECWGYRGTDGHAHLCSCGATDTLLAHTPGPEATEDATQICTVCLFELAPKQEHTHRFEQILYTWNDANTACTASRPCAKGCGYADTESATVVTVSVPVDCVTEGSVTYTAIFTNPLFSTQTKTVKTADPLGHSYTARIESDTYLKERALTCATADTYWYACSRCSASAEEDGAAESCFYASLTFGPHHFDTESWGYKSVDGHAHLCSCGATDTLLAHTPGPEATEEAAQVCTVCLFELAPKLPHTHRFDQIIYTWNDTHTACTANRPCAKGCGYADTESATVGAVSVPVDCVTEGSVTYTATFTNPLFSTQTKTVKTADPLGHSYTVRIETDAYLKERALTCTTADTYWYACSRCSASAEEDGAAESCFYASLTFGPHHFDTESWGYIGTDGHAHLCSCGAADLVQAHVPGPEATEDAAQICTACLFELAPKLPHTHRFDEILYTWNDGHTACTASRPCAKGCGYADTEVTAVQTVSVAASCLEDGYVTHTATFTNPLFSTQTKVIPGTAKLGHLWTNVCDTLCDRLGCNAEREAPHDLTCQIVSETYLKEEATFEHGEIYYKSCSLCGETGNATFEHGSKLREYTEAEKQGYLPQALTMTMYDPSRSLYGFTFHTDLASLRPVIQICEGDTLTENYQQFLFVISESTANRMNGQVVTYYIAKLTLTLKPNTTYTYRIYDKYVGVGTETVTFTTPDPTEESFTFSYMSDSQGSSDKTVTVGTGATWNTVLDNIDPDSQFILHGGDLVQWGYQEFWRCMLNENFEHLSKIPIMAVAGNHDTETPYQGNFHEMYKHFHNKIPAQSSTAMGHYYSFVYGDVKFIMVNTNDWVSDSNRALKPEHYNWLESELKNNTCKWTIVVMHYPVYSTGKWGLNPSLNAQALVLQEQLQGLYAEYGVDLVLQAHEHVVCKTHALNANGNPVEEQYVTENGISYTVNPDGVIYALCGAAGPQARGPVDSDPVHFDYSYYGYPASWADITVDGDTLTVTVKYIMSSQVFTYATWGIMKTE